MQKEIRSGSIVQFITVVTYQVISDKQDEQMSSGCNMQIVFSVFWCNSLHSAWNDIWFHFHID